MYKTSIKDVMRSNLQRYSAILTALALSLSVLSPIILTQNVEAAQLSSRSITMASSQRAKTDVTYTVTFTPGTYTAQGVVIEFCANSPLVGSSCTAPANANTLEGFDVNEAGLAVTAGYSVNAATTTNRLILNHAGASYAGAPVTITLGSSGGSDGITNPTYDGLQPATFYARILTYTSSATANAYTDTAPGAYSDYGGIALSTANQLTVNARVQEELEFCVGAVADTVISNATAPANCTDNAFDTVASPTVDLGIVSSGAPSISPVDTTSGGNDLNGAAMVRTNAVGGTTVVYFAEQNASSGRLKVAGATCSGSSGFDAGSSDTDQCFNSSTTQTSFATSGEKFGITIGAIYRPTGSTTTNLTESAPYDGDGTAATGFAWQSNGTTSTLATSSSVLDYEMLLLQFAARSAATTPSGFYSVTSTYVATPVF